MSDIQDNELALIDYHAGMKYKDIAEKYGVSINTVKSWKTRYKWCKDKKKGVHTKEKKVCTQNKAVAKEVESVTSNNGLTDKQRLFCIYYSKTFNAVKAYQKAYECDYISACASGARLLENVKVKEEIIRLKEERYSKAFLSQEDIFQKYMEIAFSDITNYIEFGNEETKYTDKNGNERTRKRSYVNINDSNEVDGTLISEVSQGKDGVKVKLADRMKALQWLSDHMDIATEEQKARIEQIQANTARLNADKEEQTEGVVIINDIPKPDQGKTD